MANTSQDFSQLNISEEEKDKLVAEVIRYVLFKTHQNSGCPIKRDELTQIVTKNYHQRLLPALVINEAIAKLSSIFGFEMRELQRSRPSSTNQQSNDLLIFQSCDESIVCVFNDFYYVSNQVGSFSPYFL